MEKKLVLSMLNEKAFEQRKNAEYNAFFVEELGFRELICLEEKFQWEEYIKETQILFNQDKLIVNQQQKLDQFRSKIMNTFGLDELQEKEIELQSSIINLQNRFNRAEEWLKAFSSSPTDAVQEKMHNWNEEKEVLELQIAQLRIRIAKLNEGPSILKVSHELDSNLESIPTMQENKNNVKNMQAFDLAEKTKETLARVRDILL